MLGFAVAWFTLTELSWVDDRPYCSAIGMGLRPDLGVRCFGGPRPFPDEAALPAMWVAFVTLMTLVALVAATRRPQPRT